MEQQVKNTVNERLIKDLKTIGKNKAWSDKEEKTIQVFNIFNIGEHHKKVDW